MHPPSLRFLILSLAALGSAPAGEPPPNAVDIIAHRGASAAAPENTVAAFRLAWRQGADSCELDLHLTADHEIAVLHDANTQRTTGNALAVERSTLAELQALDAGSRKSPEFAGERIPSLKQALATLPGGNHRFFLEIKGHDPAVIPVLARQLAPWKPRARQLRLIAFDRSIAREAKQTLPWLEVYRISAPANLDQLIRHTLEDGLDGLDLGLKWPWTPEMVREVRDAGLKLYVWTVNQPDDVKRLAALGIDGITTDDPVMARRALTGP